jgi:hypothetical protein
MWKTDPRLWSSKVAEEPGSTHVNVVLPLAKLLTRDDEPSEIQKVDMGHLPCENLCTSYAITVHICALHASIWLLLHSSASCVVYPAVTHLK